MCVEVRQDIARFAKGMNHLDTVYYERPEGETQFSNDNFRAFLSLSPFVYEHKFVV